MGVLKQSQPRVEPILVSLSEGNWISMFSWRENQLCKVLKVLPSKTGSQNWILLLADHKNMLTHKKRKHFLCEKCVTLLISLFTLSPTPELNSIWWYIWLVATSLYTMMFWGLIQQKMEGACWPLKIFWFFFFATSNLKSLVVNRRHWIPHSPCKIVTVNRNKTWNHKCSKFHCQDLLVSGFWASVLKQSPSLAAFLIHLKQNKKLYLK